MVQQLWSRDIKAENIFFLFLYIYKNIHIIYYHINIYIFPSFPKKLSPGPFPCCSHKSSTKGNAAQTWGEPSKEKSKESAETALIAAGKAILQFPPLPSSFYCSESVHRATGRLGKCMPASGKQSRLGKHLPRSGKRSWLGKCVPRSGKWRPQRSQLDVPASPPGRDASRSQVCLTRAARGLFYVILFYFYFILSYFTLVYFILFYSILFCYVLFYFILFYSILLFLFLKFYFILYCFILF